MEWKSATLFAGSVKNNRNKNECSLECRQHVVRELVLSALVSEPDNGLQDRGQNLGRPNLQLQGRPHVLPAEFLQQNVLNT